MRRIGSIVLGAIVVAGCGGAVQSAPPPVATPTPPVTRSPVALVTPSPTPEPTATVAPAPYVVNVSESVKAWYDVGANLVPYQVFAVVRNDGTGWADMSHAQSTYAVLNAKGATIAQGKMFYPFPRYLGPGETGYLCMYAIAPGTVPLAAFATAKIDLHYVAAEGAGPALTVSGVKVQKPQIAALVKNDSGDAVSQVSAGLVMLDAKGLPLYFTWTADNRDLTPGMVQPLAFAGISPPVPAKPAKTLTYASPIDPDDPAINGG